VNTVITYGIRQKQVRRTAKFIPTDWQTGEVENMAANAHLGQVIPDVWRYLAGFLPGPDRTALSSSCRLMRRYLPPTFRIIKEAGTRVLEALGERGLDVPTLLAALKEDGAVLTGDFILQAIVGKRWEGTDLACVRFMGGNAGKEPTPKESVLRALLTPEERNYICGWLMDGRAITLESKLAELSMPRPPCIMRNRGEWGFYDTSLSALVLQGNSGERRLPHVLIAYAVLLRGGTWWKNPQSREAVAETILSFNISCQQCFFDGEYCYSATEEVAKGIAYYKTNFTGESLVLLSETGTNPLSEAMMLLEQETEIEKYRRLGFTLLPRNFRSVN